VRVRATSAVRWRASATSAATDRRRRPSGDGASYEFTCFER
jgi:hypothetical protein